MAGTVFLTLVIMCCLISLVLGGVYVGRSLCKKADPVGRLSRTTIICGVALMLTLIVTCVTLFGVGAGLAIWGWTAVGSANATATYEEV